MPPADLTTTLSFNSTDPAECHFDPEGPFELEENQSLVVSLADFPAGSTMSFLALRKRSDPCTVVFFPEQPGIENASVFSVQANSNACPLPTADLVITITDTEAPMIDEIYDLNVHGVIGRSLDPWQSDPEVINKAGGTPADNS